MPQNNCFQVNQKKSKDDGLELVKILDQRCVFKIVDDDSREIIRQSTIRSANKPDTANLQVDPLEPPPSVIIDNTDVLEDFISLADFAAPFNTKKQSDPVDSIPDSTK